GYCMTELREAWRELLARRRALVTSLAPYDEMLERWAAWRPPRRSLSWSAQRCRESWTRGVPLTVEAPPPLDADNLEDLLGGAMEDVAAVTPARAPALQRLAGAWAAGVWRVTSVAAPGPSPSCAVGSAASRAPRTWCACRPKARMRAMSSPAVALVAPTSKSWTVGSAGTAARHCWRTGPRPTSTSS